MNDLGDGIPQDFKEAKTYYEKGCDGGHRGGCVALGDLYAEGRGVEKDAERARRLYQESCDAGSRAGCEKIKALGE
jgi:TPR repeat protein